MLQVPRKQLWWIITVIGLVTAAIATLLVIKDRGYDITSTCPLRHYASKVTFEKSAPYLQDATIHIEGFDQDPQVSNVSTSYHAWERHDCNYYFLREFGLDLAKSKILPNFDVSIWAFNDPKVGLQKLLTLATLDSKGKEKVDYRFDFRVSPNEEYLVLEERGTQQANNNLVIKSLKNFKTNQLKDILSIPFKDILGSNENIYGELGLGEWSDDSRYFWGYVFLGAETTALVRVDMKTRTYEVYEAPDGTLNGDFLTMNPNTGFMPYDPNSYWSPDDTDMEGKRKLNRERGIKSELRLFNGPSQKSIFVDSIPTPLWRFSPKWISDTTLEYTLPDGSKKTFTVPETVLN